MKKSTQIISGGSTATSLNFSHLNFKNNAELAKAFDLLYFHVSPVPKPFPGYTSLENVVSKNLQVTNSTFVNKHSNQSQFHSSSCNLHSSPDVVNTSVESYGSMPASHRSSTSRMIKAIKERHAQLINSTGNETVLNTFSVTKDKKNVNLSQESCELKDLSTGTLNETNDFLHCNEKGVLDGNEKEFRLKNSKMRTREKNHNKAKGLLNNMKEVQIVLKKCDNMSPDENKVTIKDTEMNILTDWIIKPVPGCNGVCVEGKKKGMEDYWHSTAIAEVRKAKVVVTISGSVYRLKGRINKLCTIDNGFPKEVAAAFANGFPKNWRELIQEYFISVEKSISFHKEEIPVKIKKRESQSKRSQLSDNEKNTKDTLEKTIMTRTGLIQQQFNASDMVVTRSGRISLPPLKRWMGQHYVMNSNSNTFTVACKTKTGEEFLSRETQQILQTSSKVIQKDIFHKSLSNTLNSPSAFSSHTKENINETFPNPKGRKPDRICLKKNILEEDLKKGYREKRATRCSDKANSKLQSKDETVFTKSTKGHGAVESLLRDKKSQDMESRSKSADRKKRKNKRDSTVTSLQSSPDEVVSSAVAVNFRRNAKKSSFQNESQPDKNTEFLKQSSNRLSKKTEKKKCFTLETEQKAKKEKTREVRMRKSRSSVSSESVELIKKKERTQLEDFVKQKKGRAQFSEHSNKSLVQKEKRKLSGETDRSTEHNRRKILSSSLSSQQNDSPPEDANCVSTDLDNRKPTSSRSRKRKLSASEKEESERKKKHTFDEEKTSDAWTEREQSLFHGALQIISSAEPDFWIKVSQFVESKSDVECQEFHTNYLKTVGKPKLATKPKKKNQNKGRQKGGPIKGGKGTLKRKKDLRAFLDEQNEGYEDDLFESSPMLRKKPKSLLNFDFPRNDSDIFGQNHNFFTPIAGGGAIDTPSTNIRAAIASVRKDLLDQAKVTEETPISSKRKKGDMIIKHFNDRKKKGLNFPEQEVSKDLQLSTLPVKSLFTPVARPRISIDCNEDDDEKHLYYWDDDD